VTSISILELQLLCGIVIILTGFRPWQIGHAERTKSSPRGSSGEVQGKGKKTGGTARTRTFTEATEIK